MRMTNLERWTQYNPDTKVGKEHFSLFFDSPAVVQSVEIRWMTEGITRSKMLVVESVVSNRLNGYLDGNFTGDFRVNEIVVRTSEGLDYTIQVEKGESFKAPKGLRPVTSDEATEVSVVAAMAYGDTVEHEISLNRILDWGSSGEELTMTVADGWSLPGITDPTSTTEDQIEAMLKQSYDDDALNLAYIVGDEIVFIRSSPAGNEAIRIPVSDVYVWSKTYDPGSEIRPRQMGIRAETRQIYYNAYDPDLQPPRSEHFYQELEAIFSTIDNTLELTMWHFPQLLPALEINGDRLASDHYSSYLAFRQA